MWTRPKPESLTGGDVFHLDLVSELPLRVGVQHQDRGAVLGHHFRGRAVDCGELTGRYRRRLDARCAPGAFDGRRLRGGTGSGTGRRNETRRRGRMKYRMEFFNVGRVQNSYGKLMKKKNNFFDSPEWVSRRMCFSNLS